VCAKDPRRAIVLELQAAGTFDLLPLKSHIEGTNPMNWNRVYILVKKIPHGRVMTYGQLAKALRLPGGARTAGRAMAASPSGRGVPWHRVVGAGGRLLIREPYASLQRKLLESEGLRLAEKRILDFRDYEWSPGKARRRGSPKRKKALESDPPAVRAAQADCVIDKDSC
jgi:methylated-DNA-protein-cysteine methyltransferase-like protein